MTNIISILEKIGCNPVQKSSAINKQSDNKIISPYFDDNLLHFLQAGDITAAESYLGTRSGLVCGLHPAEEPGNVPPADEPDDDKDKEQVHLQYA